MKAVDLGLSIFWGQSPLINPENKSKLFTWGDYSFNLNMDKKFKELSGAEFEEAFKNYFEDLIDDDFEGLINNDIITKEGFLTPHYDHANELLGKGWRMPTSDEFKELINKCEWQWVGNGYLVTGPNNHSIIIPYENYFHNTGRSIIKDTIFGEYKQEVIAERNYGFWSSEPSYDEMLDINNFRAYILYISKPKYNIIIVSSENRNKKNLVIPVTNDKAFLETENHPIIENYNKNPWFIDAGEYGLDDCLFDSTPPPIIPAGSSFPIPLWDKLPKKAKDYLHDTWKIDNENDYNKILWDNERVLIIQHDLKCLGII